MVLGLTLNVVAPANANPHSKLPVVVVSTLRMVRSYFANDVNPLGSGYMEASLMQYLDLFLVSNIAL